MTRRDRLTADEEDVWRQILALVEYLPALVDQQLHRDAGMGRFDYAVLIMLARAPRRELPMLDLSTVTHGSLSRLSHTVTRLTAKGYVTRTRVGASRIIALTAAGRRAALAAVPGHAEQVRSLVLDHLGHDGASELASLLRPVAEHLRAIAARP